MDSSYRCLATLQYVTHRYADLLTIHQISFLWTKNIVLYRCQRLSCALLSDTKGHEKASVFHNLEIFHNLVCKCVVNSHDLMELQDIIHNTIWKTYCFTKGAPLISSSLPTCSTVISIRKSHLTCQRLGQHWKCSWFIALKTRCDGWLNFQKQWISYYSTACNILDYCLGPLKSNVLLENVIICTCMFFTYNLYRCNAPHQLLEEWGLTVRKLPDAVSDELLLVLWEAVVVSAPQQASSQQQHHKGKHYFIKHYRKDFASWWRQNQALKINRWIDSCSMCHLPLSHLLTSASSLSSCFCRKATHFCSTQLM